MSKGITRTTYTVGIFGTVVGLALVVVSLGYYLLAAASPGAAFFLIFTFIGAVILIAGLITLVAANQSKNRPLFGVGILFISAVIGGLLGFPIIITGIMALIGVLNAFDTLRASTKTSRK